MSAENSALVEKLYQAFNSGDVPFVLGTMDPGIEWNEAEGFIYADGNPYIGPDAVLQGVFARLGGEWEGFTVAADRIFEAGDTIISCGYYSGKFRRTGQSVRAQFAHFFTFANGKMVRFNQYTDTAQFQNATA